MFLLGHLGIGKKLADPWIRALPIAPFLAGTLLPDLIDKPLYYTLALVTGKRGAELGLISGTRTIGHTAILLAAITALAIARKSPALKALAIGMLTHFILDAASGFLLDLDDDSAIVAFLWPLKGPFPAYPFKSGGEHMSSILRLPLLASELLGALLLIYDFAARARGGSAGYPVKRERYLGKKGQ
jgi:hypothetical protein